MRGNVDKECLTSFMRRFGRELREPCRVYFTGGATAILEGWRDSTVGVDLKVEPDREAFDAIALIKNELQLSIEFASPDQFIPALPDWEARSRFIVREGKVDFFHMDPYSQALSKVERGFAQDLDDVNAMIQRDLVELEELWQLFLAIEPNLVRYPAIDPEDFKRRVREFVDRSA